MIAIFGYPSCRYFLCTVVNNCECENDWIEREETDSNLWEEMLLGNYLGKYPSSKVAFN